MILVTVGAQMPFDRLVRTVDRWAGDHPQQEVFAQIGPGAWQPRCIPFVEFLSPSAFRSRVEQATLVIAHAGMGTIITALELGKPLLLLPRRGDRRETRNDHQVATARELAKAGRASVAYDEEELWTLLQNLDQITAPPRISVSASPRLIAAVRAFIHGSSPAAAHRPRPGGGEPKDAEAVAVQRQG